MDSFGSLAISDTGRTNYFGQATSSWVSRYRYSSQSAHFTSLMVPLQYYLTVRENSATPCPFI